jgi:hypothetical protein
MFGVLLTPIKPRWLNQFYVVFVRQTPLQLICGNRNVTPEQHRKEREGNASLSDNSDEKWSDVTVSGSVNGVNYL